MSTFPRAQYGNVFTVPLASLTADTSRPFLAVQAARGHRIKLLRATLTAGAAATITVKRVTGIVSWAVVFSAELEADVEIDIAWKGVTYKFIAKNGAPPADASPTFYYDNGANLTDSGANFAAKVNKAFGAIIAVAVAGTVTIPQFYEGSLLTITETGDAGNHVTETLGGTAITPFPHVGSLAPLFQARKDSATNFSGNGTVIATGPIVKLGTATQQIQFSECTEPITTDAPNADLTWTVVVGSQFDDGAQITLRKGSSAIIFEADSASPLTEDTGTTKYFAQGASANAGATNLANKIASVFPGAQVSNATPGQVVIPGTLSPLVSLSAVEETSDPGNDFTVTPTDRHEWLAFYSADATTFAGFIEIAEE